MKTNNVDSNVQVYSYNAPQSNLRYLAILLGVIALMAWLGMAKDDENYLLFFFGAPLFTAGAIFAYLYQEKNASNLLLFSEDEIVFPPLWPMNEKKIIPLAELKSVQLALQAGVYHLEIKHENGVTRLMETWFESRELFEALASNFEFNDDVKFK